MALYHILMSLLDGSRSHSANSYLLKVNNRNTRERCEICSKANNKDPKTTSITTFWCLYCYFWIYFTLFVSVSMADFDQVNICWGRCSAEHKFWKLLQNRGIYCKCFTEQLFHRTPPGDYFCLLLWLNMLLCNNVSVLRNICYSRQVISQEMLHFIQYLS